MKLLPNTYEGLTWGLTHFDAIETDLRLTKDNKLVIYHDPKLETGEVLRESTLKELEGRGIPTLSIFFSIKEVIELSKTKKMFLELKPNCKKTTPVVSDIRQIFYDSFQKVIAASEIDKSSIHIISFSNELLDPFAKEYPCYPLLPYVNECSQKYVTLKAMPQVLGTSLTKEIKKAEKRGFKGVFFARQYVMGLPSLRHPSYEKAVNFAAERGMILGSNLGTPDLESKYPKYARFSDKLSDYPRNAAEGEGPIVAHRGTGTKGVEIPDDEKPQLTF